MIKILRPCRDANIVSARVFDQLFTEHLGQVFDVTLTPLVRWCEEILGPVGAGRSLAHCAQEFARVCKGYDFFCPGHECIALAPLFLALRNEAKTNLRLLFIAHAPGSYVLQWALFRHLVVPGDLIIAPSQSGRNTIEFLCPELSPFVKVIHHPMEPLTRPDVSSRSTRRIVSLSSIHESKLIHRQIEAMAWLRHSGYADVVMDIAGPLEDFKTGLTTQYARSLMHKIKRLGLEEVVRLVGPVTGDAAKARFIAHADLLVNLSVNTEEAFPKSPIEALGLGVPVLATRWDGLMETVGEAGMLVPVHFNENDRADVSACDVAGGIEAMLKNPFSSIECRKQASKFLPERSISRYCEELEKAISVDPVDGLEAETAGAGPEEFAGLLGQTAILQAFSPAELMFWHFDSADNVRAAWAGQATKSLSRGELITDTLLLSTQQAVEQFLGQITPSVVAYSCGPLTFEDSNTPGDAFFERVARGILAHSTQRSKEASLLLLHSCNRVDLLEICLPLVHTSRVCDHLRIELDLHRGRLSEAGEQFEKLYGSTIMGAKEDYKLRQISKIYRAMENPAAIVPVLRNWLERFPDNLESGVIWLELAICALDAGPEFLSSAEQATARARELLGPIDAVSALESKLLHLQAMILFA